MSASIFGDMGLSQPQIARLLHPGMRSGVVYGPQMNGSTTGSIMAADTIYGIPMLIPGTLVISALNMVVGVAVAGVSGKMAIAKAGPSGGLGDLVAECNATVDLGLTANTPLSAGFAANPTLQPGWHWLLSKFDGAAQPYAISVNVGNSGLVALLGANSSAPFVRGLATASYLRAELAQAYASAFPTSLAAATFPLGVPGAPIMTITVA